jgi:outer membrane lipoprotein LolB
VIRAVAATCALLLLAGCATRREVVREPSGDARRATAVAEVSSWGFAGRIAVSNGNDGGSGRIDWRQDGERLDITIRAPVSGQTWRLSGDRDGGYELSGTKRESVRAGDAEMLLFNETGWRVPVAALERWVRALPAGRAQPRFGDDGLPAELREAGWTIEYRRFDTARAPALPTRIVARKGPLQVRLAIATWNHG